ncbi:MAG: hypothetical protein WC869_02560 [Phycisphaerae bacterium]|jgi:hypothetical protein
MVFRIRFRPSAGGSESETVIEARSTTEALVKFRHLRGRPSGPAGAQERVTSICSDSPLEEPAMEDPLWS